MGSVGRMMQKSTTEKYELQESQYGTIAGYFSVFKSATYEPYQVVCVVRSWAGSWSISVGCVKY